MFGHVMDNKTKARIAYSVMVLLKFLTHLFWQTHLLMSNINTYILCNVLVCTYYGLHYIVDVL